MRPVSGGANGGAVVWDAEVEAGRAIYSQQKGKDGHLGRGWAPSGP